MRKTLQNKAKDDSPVQVASATIRDLAVRAGGIARDFSAATLRPMLCDKTAVSLTREGMIYELKLDGVRILADKRGGDVTLYYRSGRDTTAAYPEVVEAVRALPFRDGLIDGEIIAFDDAGIPSFQRLQTRIMREHRPGRHGNAAATGPVQVVYVAFDVLALEGIDVMRAPLVVRRLLLEHVIPESGVVSRFPQVTSDARALFAMCKERGIEGLVAKEPNSLYFPGERTSAWAKIRIERSADFVVIGFAKGDSSRHGISALALASFEDGRFVGRGDVGSGFSDADLFAFAEVLSERVIARSDVIVTAGKDRVFVHPEVVVRVRFLSVTDIGTLRFPVFAGVRPDVSPHDCSLDE